MITLTSQGVPSLVVHDTGAVTHDHGTGAHEHAATVHDHVGTVHDHASTVHDHATAVYDQALRCGRAWLSLHDDASPHRSMRRHELPVSTWTGTVDEGDLSLVGRCHGPTLDLGCGPGRITAALAGRGIAALGVDVSAEAVALTRARGAAALHRDVFALTAGHGRWQHVLLADGNIGIGGDPLRLLWHCRDLLGASGSVLVDLSPPGTRMRCARVRISTDEHVSESFPWAWLGVDSVHEVAAGAGLAVAEVWQVERRWQAELVVSSHWPAGVPS